MIPYILHVTVITTICFLFYKLLLQKETFYRLNRWILMGCLAVSFGLPMLPVPRELSWRDKWSESTDRTAGQQVAPRTDAATKPLRITPDERSATVNTAATDAGSSIVNPTATDERSSAANSTVSDASRAASVTVVPSGERGMAVTGSKPGHREHGGMVHSPATGPGTMQSGAERVKHAVIAGTVESKKPQTAPTGKDMTVAGTPSTPIFSAAHLFLVVQWLFYGYLFGLLLFGGSFVLQIVVLLYRSYSRPVIRDGCFRIVEVRGNRAPCSFGNTIFINPENYDWETYNQILIHEKIHVSGRHTFDILLAEIAVVLQWFNPFVWWYRREVENNLEFLTDASVLLHRDVERSAYQLSLLRVSAPHLPFSITSNYNQSLLKKRIVMMNSKRSSLHTVWKYFFLLPVLSLLVCALNKPAALGATLSSVQDHSGSPAARDAGLATPANSFKFPAMWATMASAPGDTTVRPASGNSAGESRDSSREHHYYNDDDYQTLKAMTDAQRLNLDQLNLQLATAQQATVQVHLNEQKVFGQMDMAQRQLNHLNVQPSVNVNLDFQPLNRLSVDMSHLDIMTDTGFREGAWFATSSDDKLRIELKSGDDEHNWNSSFEVDKKEINPYPGQGNVEFKLVREAGTISFKGQFDGQEGFGHFKFTPDDGYMAALKQMGVTDVEDRRQFAYFTVNIKKDYVDMLVHNGYPHISQRDLISFAAMKIDKQFIQDWRGSGFDDADNPRNLISLKAMKIDRAYVDEMKAAGYDHLNIHDLMSLKAMKVDRAYIRSLGRNSDNTPIPVREVISYKAMHIDSGYVEGLRKAGYSNLSRNDVTSLYSMKVTPEYIKSLQDLGYTNISTRELTSLKAMNITPEFIKGYREMGFKDLNARELTSLKAMDVTPEFIKGFHDIGYNDLSARDLTSLKAMNVTPDFVRGFNKLGFNNISVHTLTSLKATGVDADYVAKMKAKGFVSDDLNKYIRLKNDFN